MNKIYLISDLKKTLGIKIGRLTDGYNEDKSVYVDIELRENESITIYEMPHLLTIASGYNVNIEIYSIDEDHIGLYITEMK